jgi:putative aminopeptidase FrvX
VLFNWWLERERPNVLAYPSLFLEARCVTTGDNHMASADQDKEKEKGGCIHHHDQSARIQRGLKSFLCRIAVMRR